MTYKIKFFVTFMLSVLSAYFLLQTSSSLSGGGAPALVLFCILFVVFGVVGSATYYFWSRMKNASKDEQQFLEETKDYMNVNNGEKK